MLTKVLRWLFPTTIRKHEVERAINSVKLQRELDAQHALRDAYNAFMDECKTTKESINRVNNMNNTALKRAIERDADNKFAASNGF